MSALTKKSPRKYTVEAYFASEKTAVEKQEYHNGIIWAMSGGTRNHSKISVNLTTALQSALRTKGKDCMVFNSDLKVHIEEYNSFVYPDAMVICGEEDYYNDRKDIVTNPLLIIELYPKSTISYDQTDKFRKYRSLPSFKEYILIDQNKASIEGFYRKTADTWRIQSVRGVEDQLHLYSLDCTISLQDIYWQVALEKEEGEEL